MALRDSLRRYRDALLNFASITEDDIDDFFRAHDEPKRDLKTLEYDYNLPLSLKLVFRFRHTGFRFDGTYDPPLPTAFCWGLDPVTRHSLMRKYGIYESVDQLMGIFIWLLQNCFVRTEPIVKFYELSSEQQEELICEYESWLTSHSQLLKS
jgi:hypothetical protein